MAYAIISVIGHDRPGFVQELAAAALAKDLNIEDTRAAGLGSEFAVLMGVAGATEQIDALDAELKRQAAERDFAYTLRRSQQGETRQKARRVQAAVLAMDHPGIVHSIAGFFAQRHLNIEDMNTQTRPAPHTGSPMFDLRMIVALNDDTDSEQLAQAFTAYCNEQDLDGNLEDSMEALS